MSVFDYPRLNFTGTLTLDRSGASRLDATVASVAAGPDALLTERDDARPLSHVIGRGVSLEGVVTPIHPGGAAPGEQFFVREFSWHHGDAFEITGAPSKATARWQTRTRNVNLAGDAGVGFCVHHVIETERGGRIRLPEHEDDHEICGVILRYCVFARHGNTPSEVGARYEVTGSFSPLRRDDPARSGPVGRLLVCPEANIPTPPGTANNAAATSGKAKLGLGPAVARWQDGRLSLDLLASFPEHFKGSSDAQWDGSDRATLNPKFDFGPVSLVLRGPAGDHALGTIDYVDAAAGDRRGWIFELDLSNDAIARELLDGDAGTLHLVSADYGDVLGEVEHQIVSDTLAVYAEQHGSRDRFVCQGDPREPIAIRVFRRGRELGPEACPRVDVWAYRATDDPELDVRDHIRDDFGPGQELGVDVDVAGNRVLVFVIDAEAPESYAALVAPTSMALTNAARVDMRVLASEDLSRYWDDGPHGPIANDALDFAALREHVLRHYTSLAPAVSTQASLEDEGAIACSAIELLTMTDARAWSSPRYVPAARDLSASQRTLLQAWCRRVLRDAGASRAVSIYTVEFDVLDGHAPEASAALTSAALDCQGWRSTGAAAGARLRNQTDAPIRAMHVRSNNGMRRFQIDARACGRLFREVWVRDDGSEAVFFGADWPAGEERWMRVPAGSSYEARCCDGYGKCPFSSQVFADEDEARARVGDGLGWLRHHGF